MVATKCIKVWVDEDGQINQAATEAIREGAQIILHDGVVAFPTETVYGLGANALSPAGVKEIFRAKGRPTDNPLIVHVASMDMLVGLVDNIPPIVHLLADKFWPGPLTMVMQASPLVPREVTGGLSTVGIRMPSHPVALALIKEAGVPLAAPSANTSGRPSPTKGEHVLEDLSGKITLLLDAGPVGVGVESTVLDLTGETPMILRPGGVTLEQLRQVIGPVDVDPGLLGNGPNGEDLAPKAPGMKYTHYAPAAEVIAVVGELAEMVAKVKEIALAQEAAGLKVGVMASQETAAAYAGIFTLIVGSRQDLSTVAVGLFDALREFDHQGVQVVVVETFPSIGIGMAIMNRLLKAASHTVKTNETS